MLGLGFVTARRCCGGYLKNSNVRRDSLVGTVVPHPIGTPFLLARQLQGEGGKRKGKPSFAPPPLCQASSCIGRRKATLPFNLDALRSAVSWRDISKVAGPQRRAY